MWKRIGMWHLRSHSLLHTGPASLLGSHPPELLDHISSLPINYRDILVPSPPPPSLPPHLFIHFPAPLPTLPNTPHHLCPETPSTQSSWVGAIPTSRCHASGCKSCGKSSQGASGSLPSSPWLHSGARGSWATSPEEEKHHLLDSKDFPISASQETSCLQWGSTDPAEASQHMPRSPKCGLPLSKQLTPEV